MATALATLTSNEKSIGMELKKTVRLLAESREEAVKSMAETISLAADAGDIILSARGGARCGRHLRSGRIKR